MWPYFDLAYYIDSTVIQENALLSQAIDVHFFIKIQLLKIISDKNRKLSKKDGYDLFSGMIKMIDLEHYAHLNIPNYEKMKSRKYIVNALAQGSMEGTVLNDKELNLKEAKQRQYKETNQNTSNQDEKTQASNDIGRAKTKVINFLNNKFFKEKSNEPKLNSEETARAEYNRRMGLVAIDKQFKQKFEYTEEEMPGSDSKVRTLQSPIEQELTDFYEEHDIDLSDEYIRDELTWPQTICELTNPVTKLTHAKHVHQQIALSNQNLRARVPQAVINDLMNRIIEVCDHIKDQVHLDNTIEIRKVFFSLLAQTCFGRRFQRLRICQTPPSEEVEFKNDAHTLFVSPDYKKVWLKFSHYKHEFALLNDLIYFENNSVDTIEFMLPPEIEKLFATLIDSFPYDQMTITGYHMMPKKTFINRFLKDQQINSTEQDLLEGVSRNYSYLTGGDLWLQSIFTGKESGLQKTQRHYASVPQRKTQRIFEKHCELILETTIKPYRGYHRNGVRIGSPYYIRKDTFSDIMQCLQELFSPLNEPVKFEMQNLEEFLFRFNAMAIYLDLFCGFSCAIRNITDPIVELKEISQQGLYRVNDKNKFDGFNTRITYVPPELRNALAQYSKVRKKLIIAFKKAKVVSSTFQEIVESNTLIYLKTDPKGKVEPLPYRRTEAKLEFFSNSQTINLDIGHQQRNLLSLLEKYKTNVNRHYLRGRLLELGVPGHFIDAYLGHWHTGTQPWGEMCLFNSDDYFRQMRQHIPTILRELGFPVLDDKPKERSVE
ncbi:hypothetical protein CYQ88_09845 [Hydrogenovibrio sp. SC-1]|uniref:hypothetical protein n=1 Tax=Hydrogenovibrio sp. SC-1 TaxID=2065820 RepID=UPI000C7BA0D2|nr:hypothetical protein [Hydrogenovibrio sp. SC-1]PLA73683.1 hypothetical protein CYQ88_09845 [Hydrogenovibrio sp. SC-1]